MMGPMDYSLCDQTVTVYRKSGNQIIRRVISGCYYHWKKQRTEDETGARQEVFSLLILPGNSNAVKIGDRVIAGEGAQLPVTKWSTFLPGAVEGLSEINYMEPCYLDGEICHIEAGRK